MRKTRLLDLPKELLRTIITKLKQPAYEGAIEITTEGSLQRAYQLTTACKRVYEICQSTNMAIELCLSSRLTDRGLLSLLSGGTYVRRLGLRGCVQLDARVFRTLVGTCASLRVLDVSYTRIDDAGLLGLVTGSVRTMRSLAVHGCQCVTRGGLGKVFAMRVALAFLDVGGLGSVVDDGVVRALVAGVGQTLQTLVVSGSAVTDAGLGEIARGCAGLVSLTVRGLDGMSEAGLEEVCKRLGKRLQILDILDCKGITQSGYMRVIREAPKIYQHFVGREQGNGIRDNIICTLPSLIYRISATDAIRRLPALYFLLVDESALRSFRIMVQAHALNLSNFGIVLVSNFGNVPSQNTKRELLLRYGHHSVVDEEGVGKLPVDRRVLSRDAVAVRHDTRAEGSSWECS